ncbi:DUF4190 domain-containing protein [Amycolatopsis sp. NBC_01480]|uniref:DUF4190 domain-containing protein n=1 Tax=Amycolatopsis sp. NBC_01480 TaxID=2903562 RepID=UPI002E2B42C3|nr:DUF4190 domain-containing protein [Amycolatopsis sp. NBC_01480]
MTDPYQQQPYPGQDPNQPGQAYPGYHPSAPLPVPYNGGPYPSPYPGYGVPMVPMVPLRTSGLAVAGMVVGIVALISFWVPFFDILVAGAAIGLSWAGMVQGRKPGWTGSGMGIAGLVCGILAAIPGVIVLVFFFAAAAAGTTSCAAYC